MDLFSINITARGDVMVVAPTGRIDSATAPDFDAQLEKTVRENKKLILDLSQVGYLSSAGVRALVRNVQVAEKAGCTLKVAALNSMVKDVLETVGMLHVLKTHATVDEAAAEF